MLGSLDGMRLRRSTRTNNRTQLGKERMADGGVLLQRKRGRQLQISGALKLALI